MNMEHGSRKRVRGVGTFRPRCRLGLAPKTLNSTTTSWSSYRYSVRPLRLNLTSRLGLSTFRPLVILKYPLVGCHKTVCVFLPFFQSLVDFSIPDSAWAERGSYHESIQLNDTGKDCGDETVADTGSTTMTTCGSHPYSMRTHALCRVPSRGGSQKCRSIKGAISSKKTVGSYRASSSRFSNET
ncbi:hypothetical protein EDD18DRAFT_384210 [Armillaria luteobubalina]|uniref:Uncharacterized protein n=1 Tax=Armillaria luteobubalina TaxID=153913 RepID=A0AA39URG0_9AGAR|nr:hypothetical protein EDD18DRAFT_384210 [Armillaria luteobubalina]